MQNVCYEQDVLPRTAAFDAEDFARCTVEAFRTCSADQSLGCGDEAWEQEEPAEGGDLGVCEDGGFSEDSEAVCGEGGEC